MKKNKRNEVQDKHDMILRAKQTTAYFANLEKP